MFEIYFLTNLLKNLLKKQLIIENTKFFQHYCFENIVFKKLFIFQKLILVFVNQIFLNVMFIFIKK